MTIDGVVTANVSTGQVGPQGIASGPDRAMWFGTYSSNSVGRIAAPQHVQTTPQSAGAGAAVTVLGGGFAPGDTITVNYRTDLPSPPSVQLCHTTATSAGKFACKSSIPSAPLAGPAGEHAIIASGSGQTSAAVAITVN